MRPNPVAITEALRELEREGKVKKAKKKQRDAEFFAGGAANLEEPPYSLVFLKRLALYRKFMSFAHDNDLCGFVLEKILDQAAERTGVAVFVSRFPSCVVPANRPLDSVFYVGDVLVGVECKNLREWLYPESVPIWELLSKCCKIDAVPVLITRKVPYVSYLMFKRVGLLAYQTHFQYFHPVLKDEVRSIMKVDGLGFKDIRATEDADSNLERFLGRTLVNNAVEFRERFTRTKSLVRMYADERGLSDQSLKGQRRASVYRAFWKQLTGRKLDEDTFV